MAKIKEFKGSLNPIFKEDIQNTAELDSDMDQVFQESKDYLLINQITPRGDQPRKSFNESSLEELAQSIKSNGVIQPIIVRSIGKNSFEIIAGERRWRAAKKAGLEKIPAIIREYNRSEGMAVALIENIQRENLNPLEEAQAIQNLLDECDMTHAQVAENLGKSRTSVSNLLRLLALTAEVKVMINSGLLEMGHARALLGLNSVQQIEAAKVVIGKALSVRDTEKLVQRFNMPEENKTTYIDHEFEKKAAFWKTKLSRKLSSVVNVHVGTDGKGKVVIHFNSMEEANWLMEHVGFTEVAEVE